MYAVSQNRSSARPVSPVAPRPTPLPTELTAAFRLMEFGQVREAGRPPQRAGARPPLFGRGRTAARPTRNRTTDCGLGSCSFTATAGRRQAICLTHWRAATAIFAVRTRVA
jgi:hypothetical protein